VLRTSNNRAQQKKMMFLERNLEQLTVVQRQLVEQNSGLKKEVAIAERKLIARNERIQSLESLLQDSQEKLTAANHRYVSPSPPSASYVSLREPVPICSVSCAPLRGTPDPLSSALYDPLRLEHHLHSSALYASLQEHPPSGSSALFLDHNQLTQHHSFEAQLTAVKERLEAAKAGSTRGLGSPAGGASYAGAFGGGVGSRIAKPLRGGGGPVQDGPVLPVIGNLQKQDGDGEANKAKRTSWFFNQR
jgi:kinesin family protein 5